MSRIRCPICNEEFDPEQSAAMPFCSERCRRIDLGRWLDERYALPIERPEEEQDTSAPPDDL
ncbi:MAG TPA: DNA gyrase inhibitor YacG [Pirellulales bacterium]|nr:DNA gyrase inhibitor YacG [Pirellulales bacterium]